MEEKPDPFDAALVVFWGAAICYSGTLMDLCGVGDAGGGEWGPFFFGARRRNHRGHFVLPSGGREEGGGSDRYKGRP